MKQTTLRKEVSCTGVGLHSGRSVGLTLKPAPAGTGVVFSVKAAGRWERISPHPERIVSTGLATTLGGSQASVSTIEHLMAALAGLEIDNVFVEVDGAELPILDGSAAAYIYLIKSAGIQFLDSSRVVAKIVSPLRIESANKFISVKPYSGLKIDYTISFDHPRIGTQFYSYESSPFMFERLIARARTFGFMRDVEKLQQAGLALGGSLDNAVVFDEYGVVNPEGLRFADEMVRHKILDFMGDIAIGPHRLYGHFEVFCSGHDLNNRFMRHLFAHADDYLAKESLAVHQSCLSWKDRVISTPGLPAWA